jgi:hypothetical protein
MVPPRLPDSARVPIGLTVSEAEAAQIDEVLARSEFAGWTRSEWCREIIRSALRYYAGKPPAPDPGQNRDSDRPEADQATSSGRPSAPAAGSPVPAAVASGPAAPPDVTEARAAPTGPEPEPRVQAEPPAQPECAHPADAWDYDTGTCGACGAVL